jgi:hypothetical protein
MPGTKTFKIQISVTQFAMAAVEKREYPGIVTRLQPVAGKELNNQLWQW